VCQLVVFSTSHEALKAPWSPLLGQTDPNVIKCSRMSCRLLLEAQGDRSCSVCPPTPLTPRRLHELHRCVYTLHVGHEADHRPADCRSDTVSASELGGVGLASSQQRNARRQTCERSAQTMQPLR